jgi:hypothetical protein
MTLSFSNGLCRPSSSAGFPGSSGASPGTAFACVEKRRYICAVRRRLPAGLTRRCRLVNRFDGAMNACNLVDERREPFLCVNALVAATIVEEIPTLPT